MTKTYLFYDIETTGLNKAFDQIVQFAAIRTDLQLNELERHEYFVKLNPDVIPTPKAFITHRVSLAQLEQGVNEVDALQKIHQLFNTPNTITLGYNTLGFDDEFLRFSFYRNLLPAYTHQYANGCSRMDLYPMALLYYLYKPGILNWPSDNLKLENISTLNQLATGQAHNALTDVVATINLARRLQQDMPMWEYVCGFFDKQIDLTRCQNTTDDQSLPLAILVDGKFGTEHQYQCIATPLGMHNHYKNQMLWLRLDLPALKEANPDKFLEHTWVIAKKMGEPCTVLPLKERYLKSPLKSKQDCITENVKWLQENPALLHNIKSHYQQHTYPPISQLDVSAALYEKGFMSYKDQDICREFQCAPPNHKADMIKHLSQEHLQELALRVIGRHYPDYLSPQQLAQFQEYLGEVNHDTNTHHDYRGNKRFTRQEAIAEINALKQNFSLDQQQQILLTELFQLLTKHNY